MTTKNRLDLILADMFKNISMEEKAIFCKTYLLLQYEDGFEDEVRAAYESLSKQYRLQIREDIEPIIYRDKDNNLIDTDNIPIWVNTINK